MSDAMSRQCVGVDIIEIERIRAAAERWGASFLERVFTPAELAAYAGKMPSLAARFSGKEAVIKALDLAGISLTDIEILSSSDGRPLVNLYGQAKARADEMHISHLDISLSHSRDFAVACAVGLFSGA